MNNKIIKIKRGIVDLYFSDSYFTAFMDLVARHFGMAFILKRQNMI